jgi:hypothetical protein
MSRLIVCIAGVLALLIGSTVRADEPATAKAIVPDRATLEKQFEETMSGCRLVGYFTTTGSEAKGLKEEKYTITKVKKLQNDYWLFQTRIQYGGKDATLPLQLEVKWAGDTAVITLTDLAIPGFGTFTSRVLIYRGQYAGTWSGADHGGHLFGTIEKIEGEVK